MRVLLFLAACHIMYLPLCNAQDMSAAANQFISLLDEPKRKLTLFQFDSEERFNFHYFPIEDRKGLPLDKMNAKQKDAAFRMLQSSLSNNAVKKVKEIIELENILRELENRKPGDNFRDPGRYYLAIFGIPGEKSIWAWRFEGHHVSFNFSSKDNTLVAGTPGFLGANPAIVPHGPEKGKEVLKDEKTVALAFLRSLNKEQLSSAIINTEAPSEIITGNKREAMIEEVGGLRYSELTKSQQEKLVELVSLYVRRYKKQFADNMLGEIKKAGFDKLTFAWAGHTETGPGHPHYYRIVGPTIIIEYDNTQSNANHVHTVVRDVLHDFGDDELLEHYKKGGH